jgi:hypothetical protein
VQPATARVARPKVAGFALVKREVGERLGNNARTIGRRPRCLPRSPSVLLKPGAGLGGGGDAEAGADEVLYKAAGVVEIADAIKRVIERRAS